MFVILGVLSILIGLFVFIQASTLLRISMLINSIYGISGTFLLVSFAFIFSGAMLIASKEGEKTNFLSAAVISYIVLFILAVSHFSYGDMAIWTFVSIGIVAIIAIWSWRHPGPEKAKPMEETFVDPEMIKKDDQK